MGKSVIHRKEMEKNCLKTPVWTIKYKPAGLLIYLSRVRVPEGALKVLVLRTHELRGRCFFCAFEKPRIYWVSEISFIVRIIK